MLSNYPHSTTTLDDTAEIRRIAQVEASKMIPKPGPTPVDGSLIAVVSFGILAMALVGYVSEQRDALDLHAKGVLLTAVGVVVILAVVLAAAWAQDRRQARRVDNIAKRLEGIAARVDRVGAMVRDFHGGIASVAAEVEQTNALLSRALSGDGGSRLSVAVDRADILKLASALADRRAAGDERPMDEMSEREWRAYSLGVQDRLNRPGGGDEPPLD